MQIDLEIEERCPVGPPNNSYSFDAILFLPDLSMLVLSLRSNLMFYDTKQGQLLKKLDNNTHNENNEQYILKALKDRRNVWFSISSWNDEGYCVANVQEYSTTEMKFVRSILTRTKLEIHFIHPLDFQHILLAKKDDDSVKKGIDVVDLNGKSFCSSDIVKEIDDSTVMVSSKADPNVIFINSTKDSKEGESFDGFGVCVYSVRFTEGKPSHVVFEKMFHTLPDTVNFYVSSMDTYLNSKNEEILIVVENTGGVALYHSHFPSKSPSFWKYSLSEKTSAISAHFTIQSTLGSFYSVFAATSGDIFVIDNDRKKEVSKLQLSKNRLGSRGQGTDLTLCKGSCYLMLEHGGGTSPLRFGALLDFYHDPVKDYTFIICTSREIQVLEKGRSDPDMIERVDYLMNDFLTRLVEYESSKKIHFCLKFSTLGVENNFFVYKSFM